jgi:hypothetical protein
MLRGTEGDELTHVFPMLPRLDGFASTILAIGSGSANNLGSCFLFYLT